ncbi:DUF4301 family protein [Gottschalkiaceae bacterium SANA]|nr:DUF4301 family protein [Gottschalkiaceae bacterium SANA]
METFIEKFNKGRQYSKIVKAAAACDLYTAGHEDEDYLNLRSVKFIPASGAATRMFQDLYAFIHEEKESESVSLFFDQLENFAFFGQLTSYVDGDIDKGSPLSHRIDLARALLETGLNYGNLPKALIQMHAYGKSSLTPIDEHIYEGEHYLKPDQVRLHFTISKEHEDLFKAYRTYVAQDKPHVEMTYSFQNPSTDTLAVDLHNQPFLLDNGKPLYRAGGHGALIENLNDLDADLVFIKNIDNVCHKDHVQETIDSKKHLASIGMGVKKQIDRYLKVLLSGSADLSEIETFIRDVLKIETKLPLTKESAFAFLNRPLRICGMVKNQGEPGGGPFLVDNGDYMDLQICEKAEIDLRLEENVRILGESKYFNPVDLVCFVRDYQGNKFNLLDYVNENRYFISEKSYKGRKLKALEHPGLWNGAMHNWNTVFVEVPLSTFNPVKTVNDLLRAGHQPK